MIIKTLENTALNEIAECFNKSFKNYFVNVELTPELLLTKMKADATDLSYSVGAFENDNLVAFILHGVDNVDSERVAYNGGTGVIEEFRGKSLTLSLYEYILPILKNNGIHKSILEVIKVNHPAVKQYEKVGFKRKRGLACFSGGIKNIEINSHFLVKEFMSAEWEKFQQFWNWKPTWQHSDATINRQPENYKILGIENEGILMAYGIVNPETGRVAQFGVHNQFRRKRIATLLFNHIQIISKKPISVINVDENDTASMYFLKKLGLENNLDQFEMEYFF